MAGRDINRRGCCLFRTMCMRPGVRLFTRRRLLGSAVEPATGRCVADGAGGCLAHGDGEGAVSKFRSQSDVRGPLGSRCERSGNSVARAGGGRARFSSVISDGGRSFVADRAGGLGQSRAQGRSSADSGIGGSQFESAPPQSGSPAPVQSQIPPGCDPAFSPISMPLLANIFRRCIA